MKEIQLTKGKVTFVDDKDFEWLNQWKWQANKQTYKNITNFYAVRSGKRINGKRLGIKMHRFILNAPKGIEVDHRDTDGLNNQRYNLRLCTCQQNNMNINPYRGCSSKYKGVGWHKKNKKWQVQIALNRKSKHLGYFVSETEAALAYNFAATKLFGEFARLNIIEEKHA
jgi:hypothetical protein